MLTLPFYQVESTTTDTTRSDSPILTPTVADDTAIKAEPKQHVDYLSHEWREEDIWSSWRHIVSQRRVYGQRSRLENASWRTWAKSKYSLRTVSPETLNWLKESDVTWLYGPLKPAESHPITAHRSEPASQLSKSSSFVSKKPILKKRSMSEVMLQQSITTSSLLKQAAASVQAQQGKPRNPFLRAGSDVTTSRLTLDTPSRDQLDYFASRSSSSDSATPSEGAAKRHIRFDEKVEQCIAVDNKDDGFENSDNESEDEQHHHSSSDDSSDEGLVMMKRKKRPSRKRAGSLRSKNRRSGSCGAKSCRKTIETLPATTLKYRTDSPETADQAQQHHTFGRNWSPHTLSPSPSSETLRPTHPSRNFLINNDERDCEGEAEPSTWSFGASNPKSSLGSASPTTEMEQTTWSKPSSNRGPAAGGGGSSSHRSPMPGPARMRSVSEPGVGEEYSFGGGMSSGSLRRTPSGMLMPYADGEDEDDLMAIGLFGRVSETINTAKDIAHVIWNVGWRK